MGPSRRSISVAEIEGSTGLGVDMPFRSIVAEPQELAKLAAAFDTAWIDLNGTTLIPPAGQSAARERLGYIIISLWEQGEERLAAKAAELFAISAMPMPESAPGDGSTWFPPKCQPSSGARISAPTTTTITARIRIPLARAISASGELDPAIDASVDRNPTFSLPASFLKRRFSPGGDSQAPRDGNGTLPIPELLAETKKRPASLRMPA